MNEERLLKILKKTLKNPSRSKLSEKAKDLEYKSEMIVCVQELLNIVYRIATRLEEDECDVVQKTLSELKQKVIDECKEASKQWQMTHDKR